jgi:D-Tyr-tRNAtyr deacylase
MSPEPAEELFNKFVELTKKNLGEKKVQTGKFGTLMEVNIVNHGPGKRRKFSCRRLY